MVGDPEPVVFHIHASGEFGDVDGHVCGDAMLVQIRSRDSDVGSLLALRRLEIRTREAADARVDVPQTGGSSVVSTQVVLDEDGALLLALCAYEEVRPFD